MDNWYNTIEYQTHVAEKLEALGETKYDREAYEFALEAYQYAPEYHENIPTPPPNLGLAYHVSAFNFAHCYVLHAKEVFEAPKDTLSSWGVFSSTDIGEIVYGLVRIGLLDQGPEDKKEQFEGLFLITDVL
ncbi:hypothetical protein F3I62_15815 [Pseudomonas sp. R-28-1W-6]|uniref:hypothetical protein n=1 Tax=Pseudomonas sp. R-28-1W-6 TaxID=2650101 RepID=UPI001365776E|nr:hypothetical protein [Pseudomonas sp. R-28-1W-6]MWV13569.1 hypothetical protein [Pseudomonas sp. R-28-1W-6]